MYAESDREHLIILRALLHARLLYIVKSLHEQEITPIGRRAQRWFGTSGLDKGWSEAIDTHRRYEAVCEALQSFDEGECPSASAPRVDEFLFPEFPNAGGMVLGAIRTARSVSQFLLPPVALIAAIVFLVQFWPSG